MADYSPLPQEKDYVSTTNSDLLEYGTCFPASSEKENNPHKIVKTGQEWSPLPFYCHSGDSVQMQFGPGRRKIYKKIDVDITQMSLHICSLCCLLE